MNVVILTGRLTADPELRQNENSGLRRSCKMGKNNCRVARKGKSRKKRDNMKIVTRDYTRVLNFDMEELVEEMASIRMVERMLWNEVKINKTSDITVTYRKD